MIYNYKDSENFRVFASCHNHSTFSDGEYSPEVLARIAKNLGHGGIILTDHDTVKGYPFMKAAAEKYGLKTMLGIELSTFHTTKDNRRLGIHLLGFDFNPEHEAVREYIPYMASIQTARSKALFDMARAEGRLREGVEWEDVVADHPHHDYICNNEIFASFMKRGIYRYDEYENEFFVGAGFAWNRERENKANAITGKSYDEMETSDAIRRILLAGGVPVVAHPSGLMKYAEEFIELGARGFETRNSSLTDEEHIFFTDLCRERGLYATGGSDHENVLGGLLGFGEEYSSSYESSGIDREAFMTLYERRLG